MRRAGSNSPGGSRLRWGGVGAAAVVLGLLSGCGSSTSIPPGAVSVVTSTNVWGAVARHIAGPLAGTKVIITSFIDNPNADPHSYEASPLDQLALSKADLVIENGGGYDDFMSTMLEAAHAKGAVLNAVALSGHRPAPGQASDTVNEHVWYDFPSVQKVAERITQVLSSKDPGDASRFRADEKAFDAQLQRLEHTEKQIGDAHAGEPVAITEPVPVYLLDACRLVNRTPAPFSEAIENGTDVSVGVLKQTLDLFSAHQVKLLAYNEQTSGAETDAVLKAAKSAGVPVVPVTETMPAGKDYLAWMHDNLAALQKALR